MGKKIIIPDADFSVNAISFESEWTPLVINRIDGYYYSLLTEVPVSNSAYFYCIENILPSWKKIKTQLPYSTGGALGIGFYDNQGNQINKYTQSISFEEQANYIEISIPTNAKTFKFSFTKLDDYPAFEGIYYK